MSGIAELVFACWFAGLGGGLLLCLANFIFERCNRD